MRQTLGLLCLALLSLPASAGSKKRKGEGPRGMLAPDLSKVLGDGWLVPPELSDRAQPGAILDLSPGGLRVVMPDCIAASVNDNSLTNVSMQDSLSGGVRWGTGALSASASAATSLKLSFQSPRVLGYFLVDFVPSADCVGRLAAYASRGGDLSSLVVVQEALVARISGCSQTTAEAGLGALGGRASVGSTGACQLFSDAPVSVGLKTVPLQDLPEFSGIGGSGGVRLPPARDLHKNPVRVLQRVFDAAKAGDLEALRTLCHPSGDHDGDVRRLCAVADTDAETQEAYKAMFQTGTVTGKPTFSEYEGTRYAKVPFSFGISGTKTETMSLVETPDGWYLSSF